MIYEDFKLNLIIFQKPSLTRLVKKRGNENLFLSSNALDNFQKSWFLIRLLKKS